MNKRRHPKTNGRGPMTASVCFDSLPDDEPDKERQADEGIKHKARLLQHTITFPSEQIKNVQHDAQDNQDLKGHINPPIVCRV